MLQYLALTVGACVALWGCASEPSSEQAGSRLEHVLRSQGVVRLDVRRALTVRGDGTDGRPVFQRVVDATRLEGGGIVVADQFWPGLLLFDRNGKFVGAVGHRGAGPGEFEYPDALARCASDSIYVWDARLQRMSVFDSSGRLAREFQILPPPHLLQCIAGGPLAVLDKPRFIDKMDPKGRSLRRYVGTLWLADLEGKRQRTIGEFDLGENRPLGRLTHFALARDRLYVGTAESSFVDVYGFDGRRLDVVALGVPRREPTDRDYERAVDLMLEGFPERDYREQMKRQLLEIPKPDQLPWYGNLFADPEGALWVVVSAPADPQAVLLGVGRDGQPRGYVVLPEATKVLEIGLRWLVALETVETREQQLVVYEVSGAPDAAP